jgi:hypothetical protein
MGPYISNSGSLASNPSATARVRKLAGFNRFSKPNREVELLLSADPMNQEVFTHIGPDWFRLTSNVSCRSFSSKSKTV